MLVLRRKEAETIRIGGHTTITICRIHGSAVSVGISAPSYIAVERGELINGSKDGGTDSPRGRTEATATEGE